jgi:DNA-binding transcriptional ArsR family regulator
MAQRTAQEPISDVADARYAKALAHPLRVRILSMLEERNASPVQLSEHLDATLGTVAYHVRTLERLGLIEMVATHQRRGATEHVYAAREHPRFSSRAWAITHPMTKHMMIASALSQIGEVASQSAAGGFDRPEAVLVRDTIELDDAGWTQLAEATRRWRDEAAAIERDGAKRLKRSGAESQRAGLVMLLFEAATLFTDADAEADAGAGAGAGADV